MGLPDAREGSPRLRAFSPRIRDSRHRRRGTAALARVVPPRPGNEIDGEWATVELTVAVSFGITPFGESLGFAVSWLLSGCWCHFFGHFIAGSGATLDGGSRLAGWCGGCHRG